MLVVQGTRKKGKIVHSEVRSDVLERDIEIHGGPDLWLASGKSQIQAQTMSVRYLNLGVGAKDGRWLISSIDVYGQIRSKVTGALTTKSSKVCYDDPERECPKELLAVAAAHSPGPIWNLRG